MLSNGGERTIKQVSIKARPF